MRIDNMGNLPHSHNKKKTNSEKPSGLTNVTYIELELPSLQFVMPFVL